MGDLLIVGLLPLAALLLGTGAHTLFTFVVSAIVGRHPPSLSFAGTVTREWLLTVGAMLTWPLGLAGGAGPARRGEGTPVLLVHGYMMTRANFLWLRRALSRRGHQELWPVNLAWPLSSLDRHADALSDAVDKVLQATDAEQVDVVAHSMGGLASRVLVARDAQAGRRRIRRVITLGTPHAGTVLARLAVGANGRAMVPDSAFYRGLPPPPEGSLLAIYSMRDNVVVPASSGGQVEGVPSVRFESPGHFGLLASPDVADAVAQALSCEQLETCRNQ